MPLPTNPNDCDLEAVRIGDRVAVAFQPAPKARMVPMFAPSATPG